MSAKPEAISPRGVKASDVAKRSDFVMPGLAERALRPEFVFGVVFFGFTVVFLYLDSKCIPTPANNLRSRLVRNKIT